MSTKPETARPPETLSEAVLYFADESRALAFVADLRWPNGKQVCPKCGVENAHYFLAARRVWKCRDCRKQFSVKVGTIFEDSALPLSKWLTAMWMLANCRNGVSSYEVSRALKVTQKTAWFMLHRLRLAMEPNGGGRLSGTVEVDETYVGGRAEFMHKDRRARAITHGRGGMDKVSIMGMVQRGEKGKSRVRCTETQTVMTGPQKRAKLLDTSSPGARSTRTPSTPSARWRPTSRTPSWTTRRASGAVGRSTRTASRTSGVW